MGNRYPSDAVCLIGVPVIYEPSSVILNRDHYDQLDPLATEKSAAARDLADDFGIYPSHLLRSMASHTGQLRASPMYRSTPGSSVSSISSSSTSLTTSSSSSTSISAARVFCGSDPSDIELGATSEGWRYIFASKRRRQTRRTSILLVSVLISCGVVYALIDNFLLNDWVSARSRYTPAWLDLPSESRVPDYPDAELATSLLVGEGVVRVPDDGSHVLVPNSDPLAPAPTLLSPIKRFPSAMMLEYYADGRFPASEVTPIPNPTLDILYTFVNASSPVLQAAKDERAAREGLGHLIGTARHWRDNGELRGAIRSAVQNLGQGLRRVHVLSADFELDSDSDLDAEEDLLNGEEMEDREAVDPTLAELEDARPAWRIGQIPSWLDTSSLNDRLQWHFHSEVFRLPADDGVVDERAVWEWGSEDVWRDEAMPSFNSMQIEGRAGWIKDLSENFIFSNDDMFFFRDLATSDFHHPLLGPVFRLAPEYNLRVPYTSSPALKSDSGEWGGLQHANSLLSTRFYPKRRMYMSHVPKAMTRTMAQEASVMFAREWSVAGTRGFRESRRGTGDIHFSWLVTHLHIERWREALLWSWAVARLGGEEGVWGPEAREEIWDVLRLDTVAGSELRDDVIVVQDVRDTIADMEETMVAHDWEFPQGSNYLFTSLDGHLPEAPSANAALASCTFSLSRCLPRDFFSDPNSPPTSASDAFTRLAFAEPDCGDCLIMALTKASGRRGLSAFLPREDQAFAPEKRERRMWEREEPMLPLVDDWKVGNFSLQSVVRPGQDVWNGEAGSSADGAVNLRAYCVKLLSRYVYSLATSPTHFALAQTTNDLFRSLNNFDSMPNIAMGCLNDDQPDVPGSQNDAIYSRNAFGLWMERRFGGWVAGWEKDAWSWITAYPVPAGASNANPSAASAGGAWAPTTQVGPDLTRITTPDGGPAVSFAPKPANMRLKQEVVDGDEGEQPPLEMPNLAAAIEALSRLIDANKPLPIFTGGPGQG